jgi:hypothetical protein
LEDAMCYERRSLSSDEHKKTIAGASRSDEAGKKRDEVVSNLLREADQAGQKAKPTPARDYTPAK